MTGAQLFLFGLNLIASLIAAGVAAFITLLVLTVRDVQRAPRIVAAAIVVLLLYPMTAGAIMWLWGL